MVLLIIIVTNIAESYSQNMILLTQNEIKQKKIGTNNNNNNNKNKKNFANFNL